MVERDEAVLKAQRCFIDSFIERAGRIPYPKGFTWKTILEGKPRYCADTDKDEYIGSAGRKEGIKSYLSMPIGYEGKTVGCININSKEKNAIDEEELKLLEIVSHQISIAIKNAQQTEDLEFTQFSVDRFRDAAFWITPDARFSYVNDAACSLLGYSREEFLSMSVHDVDPNYSKEVWPETWEKFKQSGTLTFESQSRRKDGRILPIETTANYLYFKGKEYICAFVRDISERKEAEEALLKIKQSLSEAQRIAHLGNWDWNIRTNELVWSDEIYRIFGLKPREFGATYEAFLNCIHPDDIEFVKKSVNEALREGKDYSIDHRIILPDGSERIVHEQAEVNFDDNGEPVRMIGTVHDITERKHMEEELIKAQKLESVGILAGGIAHDFNNLLSIVMGNISLARSHTEENSSVYKNLEVAEKASHRATTLTNQLLTFSKGGDPVKELSSVLEIIK